MDKFQPSKRYIFSRDKWLTDTGNVIRYQCKSMERQLIDMIDGKEVEIINDGKAGRVLGFYKVSPEYCDVIESKRRTSFRDAVNRLMLEDKHAQLHEAINMLLLEKKKLENRIKCIDSTLAQKEEELYEVDKELIEKWTSS